MIEKIESRDGETLLKLGVGKGGLPPPLDCSAFDLIKSGGKPPFPTPSLGSHLINCG